MKKYLFSWNRLTLFYMMFALLPVIFLTVFSLSTYRNDIRSMENTLMEYSSLQTVSNLDNAFRDSKQIVAQLATDSEVVTYGEKFDSPSSSAGESALAKNKLYEKISEYSYLNSNITGVAVIGNHENYVYISRSSTSVFNETLLSDSEVQNWLLQYSSPDDLQQIQIFCGADFPDSVHTSALYFTYPLVDLITQKISGVLIVEFNDSLFLSIIKPENSTEAISARISDYSAITNSDNQILVSLQSSLLGTYFSNITESAEDFILHSTPIGKTGLFLNLVFFKGPLQQYLSNFQKGLIIYLTVISVLFFVALMITARRLKKEALYLEQIIQKFRRNPQVPAPDYSMKDELLKTLANQFNQMSQEISALLLELENKNEHIRQVVTQQKKSELKAMEAQINPHFLYNALDRINWIAIDHEQYEISDLISGLGSLLRYSLYHIDSVVMLRAELKWMEKYIFIQSKRFGRDINFNIDAEEKAIDFPIYKMLLQPLVENSILRGFYQDPPNPTIRLSATILNDGCLRICLTDNGCGMDDKQLKKISDIISSHGQIPSERVGINNIVSRLELYYGSNYKIQVQSQIGIGTTFILVIPDTTTK